MINSPKINVLYLVSIDGATIYLSTQFADIWYKFSKCFKNLLKFFKVLKSLKKIL